MKESLLKTLNISAIGGEPAILHQASKEMPIRVVVHNVGGNLVFLAHSVNDLQDPGTVGSVFQLLIGQEVVVVLAPEQTLLAAAQGGGGLLSVAISEAMPLKTWGMS